MNEWKWNNNKWNVKWWNNENNNEMKWKIMK